MKTMLVLLKRNVKLFFNDKGMFFSSLITPIILLVLYVSFLGNVYTDSLLMSVPAGYDVTERLLDGFAGTQLISSILAVSCVTVAFCSNLLMIQDKANGTLKDFTVSPVRSSVMSFSYYMATFVSTLVVCLFATGISLAYIAIIGWYFSITDVLLIILDVVILCLFGVALSSVVNFFLSTQGQMSAVGTIVSAGYGFLCGAYMPISQFSEGLRNVIMFFPGTYGTSLLRNHAMQGVLEEMKREGLPAEFIESVKDSFDCNIYIFDAKVDISLMYVIVGATIVVLLMAYTLMNFLKGRRIK
jgi:multidrug/hemolysin transport system permease protein